MSSYFKERDEKRELEALLREQAKKKKSFITRIGMSILAVGASLLTAVIIYGLAYLAIESDATLLDKTIIFGFTFLLFGLVVCAASSLIDDNPKL